MKKICSIDALQLLDFIPDDNSNKICYNCLMENQNLKIRKLNEKDFLSFKILFEDLDEYHHLALPHLFKKAGMPFRTLEHFLLLLNSEDSIFFAGEVDNQIVGIIQLAKKEIKGSSPIQIPRTVLLIDNLIIKKDYRRTGVGKNLVTKACEWAKLNSISTLELAVFEFNENAIHFYEELGFQTMNRRMNLNL